MILSILTAICASLFFTEIHNLPTKWGINFKPFNCGSCLAAWSAPIHYFLPELIQHITSTMFIAGFLAPIVSKLIWSLWK
jgi:hypothetical protein